jgi:DNA adenine methylase
MTAQIPNTQYPISSPPTRPILRYHGGKWLLAPWIISQFPTHRIYVEPYGGAASVLLRKPRAYAEIYNDLDGEIVNLFRVLRDPISAHELIRLLELTPFARAEFELSYLPVTDPIEQARRTAVRSFLGYSTATTGKWGTGFRNNSTRTGTTPAHDWRNYPAALESVVGRLRGVVIENRPAHDVIHDHDGPETLFYIDPPYPYSTRSPRWAGNAYRHELTNDDHRALAALLHTIQGMAIISGYPCPLYDDELYPTWTRLERISHADGAAKRTECLWLSPNADRAALPLFRAIADANIQYLISPPPSPTACSEHLPTPLPPSHPPPNRVPLREPKSVHSPHPRSGEKENLP